MWSGLAQSDPPDEAIFFDFLIVDKADEEAFDVFLQSFSLDRELVASAAANAAVGTLLPIRRPAQKRQARSSWT